MGINQSIQKVTFDDIQTLFKNKYSFIMINTLSEHEQDLLILNTLHCHKEEEIMNYYLKNNKEIIIIIYGKNNYEEKVLKKYNQLISLGFKKVYIYLGGLFEWLLLQEVYGFDNFPTTKKEKCVDILKYNADSQLFKHSLLLSI
jgi:hypothetical protein